VQGHPKVRTHESELRLGSIYATTLLLRAYFYFRRGPTYSDSNRYWNRGEVAFLQRVLRGKSESLGSHRGTDRFLVIDFETSGLSPAKGDRAVWLGASELTNGSATPLGSFAVQGTDGLGYFGDPPIDVQRIARREMVQWLNSAIRSAQAVVAHNAAFDARFALSEFATEGQQLPPTPWLCTMNLAQHVFPDWPNYKLVTCLDQAGIALEAEHHAGVEAQATAKLLAFLMMHAAKQGMPDLDQLLRVSRVRPGDEARFPSHSVGMELFSMEITDAGIHFSGPEYPACGRFLLRQIKNKAHRAAHESWDAVSFGATREARIAALEQLMDSGCPEAAMHWSGLPFEYDQHSRETYEEALFVLREFRDRSVADLESIKQVALTATWAVNEMEDGPSLLMKAGSEIGAWLISFAPCLDCQTVGSYCRCFDFNYNAASLIAERITIDQVAKLAPVLAGSKERDPQTDGAEWLEQVAELKRDSNEAWALVIGALGERTERCGDLVSARALFVRAVETGQATPKSHDRLSLLAERAGEFALARDVAESGLKQPGIPKAMSETLTKRALRCGGKADRKPSN
jgi:DNA polymerase-3 subunit epsilon